MRDALRAYAPAVAWQSREVLSRHLRVHLRNWHTVLLPPVLEPVILLLAFGIGLGGQFSGLVWDGGSVPYLAYLAPGILAYTAFMAAFFQALFAAFIRMRFQRAWEGQLTTMVRLEHVLWGEALWAATLGTIYASIVCLVLLGFGLSGALHLHWTWLPAALPLLFLAALAFAVLGLLFTSILPTIDHMSLPFFLVIMPIGFVSSTYFPLPDHAAAHAFAAGNPLHHLAQGLRWLLLHGQPTWHLAAAAGLCLALIVVLVPIVLRLLRRRVLGDR